MRGAPTITPKHRTIPYFLGTPLLLRGAVAGPAPDVMPNHAQVVTGIGYTLTDGMCLEIERVLIEISSGTIRWTPNLRSVRFPLLIRLDLLQTFDQFLLPFVELLLGDLPRL